MKFSHDLSVLLKRLEIQRHRILSKYAQSDQLGIPLGFHDSDFYTILLRRIFRRLEKSTSIKDVKEILVKNKALFNKIWMRDHFDHPEDFEKFDQIDVRKLPPGFIAGNGKVTIVTSLFSNSNSSYIVSGKFVWDLNKDHFKLKKLIEKIIKMP